jgi:hypothetical protein
MSRSYGLNCGQYVLMDGDRPIGRVLDEVSIALDKVEGTLHKHGSPDSVHAWHSRTQQALRSSGANEMADNLVVLTGRFPLDELNRCITHTGYAGRLYAKALAGQLEQIPLSALAPTPTPARRGARP